MKKYISIKEAAKIVGVSDQSLRNWERLGYVVPKKTPGGHRRYTSSDLDSILKIMQSKNV